MVGQGCCLIPCWPVFACPVPIPVPTFCAPGCGPQALPADCGLMLSHAPTRSPTTSRKDQHRSMLTTATSTKSRNGHSVFVRYILAGASTGMVLVITTSVMTRCSTRFDEAPEGLLHLAIRRSGFLKRAGGHRSATECDVGEQIR